MPVSFYQKNEVSGMEKIIVKPNEKGEIFIRLYGTDYKIVVEEAKNAEKKPSNQEKKEKN